MKYQVGIVGLGRVGLPLALGFLNKGVSVIGFDINESLNKSVINKMSRLFKSLDMMIFLKNNNLFSSSDFNQFKRR